MPIPQFTVHPNSNSPTTFAADMDQWISETAAWTTAANELAAEMGIAGGTLGAGVATFLLTPSSANLLAAMTDETGSGLLVFNNAPTFISPVLGTPTSGNLSNCTNAVGYGLKSATTTVSVSAATAPTAGQVLMATSDSAATWQTPAGTSLNAITAAGGSVTIANGTNQIGWNWALTGAAHVGMSIQETSASTGGSGSQVLVRIGTIAASTADPLQVLCRGSDAIRVGRLGGITLTAGSIAATAAPILTIQGGTSNAAQSGNSGGVVIQAGPAGASGVTGGPLVLGSGAGNGNAPGGNITITAAAGGSGAVAYGGDLILASGAAGGGTAARGGNLSITTGVSGGNSASVSGGMTISTGTGYNTGDITITTGAASGGLTPTTGSLTLATGNPTGSGGIASDVSITAGNGGVSGTGGSVNITLGTGLTKGYLNLVNCAVANGSVAVTLTSLGPAGAQTTIQGWWAIKNNGTIRYTPFW